MLLQPKHMATKLMPMRRNAISHINFECMRVLFVDFALFICDRHYAGFAVVRMNQVFRVDKPGIICR